MNEMKVKETSDVQTMPEPIAMVPPVDIVETENEVTIVFEVPGANSKTVEIEVVNGIMTMTARSSLKRNDRPIVFKRNFRLADDIEVKRISARSEDGVLTLTIPKTERAKVQRIKVE